MSTRHKPPNDMPARGPAMPREFEDAVVWVAWLYYADQLTQNEIADVLKVSRATIVKLLQEARERGVVSIRINTETANRTVLSRSLVERYALHAATIIPNLDGGALVSRLGDAGARALADQLASGDIVGVAWGRTVLAAARSIMPPEGVERLTVVQLSGSSTGGSADFSPELCSSLLANKLGARCVNLLAPAVLSTSELRDRLLAEPSLITQFGLIRSANKVLFGVGDIGASSTVRAAELASKQAIDAYVDSGAVAAIIGRFIDAEGRAVGGELDSRMIGLTVEELKTIPTRLCVAGGPTKITAIRAALRGGYATHLVTDIATAEALLKA
jgi:DNA-binding transcriptional regulator LsrR (DeoR family)